jgi:hypothetical protein
MLAVFAVKLGPSGEPIAVEITVLAKTFAVAARRFGMNLTAQGRYANHKYGEHGRQKQISNRLDNHCELLRYASGGTLSLSLSYAPSLGAVLLVVGPQFDSNPDIWFTSRHSYTYST